MKPKVLITGATGFAGSHLIEQVFARSKYVMYGTYLVDNSLKNIGKFVKDITLIKVNLLDKEKTFKLISSCKPDLLFHLAAMPAVGGSYENPSETIVNNIMSELNILESVKKAKLKECKILIVSSADVYGKVSKDDLPIDEETPFMPTNSYAVSKIAQDYLGLQYFLSYNLKIIRVRPFNHVGPRQSEGFVVADFAKRIAEIEKRKKDPILRVGNLEARRDFTDVRDMVYAYSLLIEKGKIGEVYNIGSGISYKIKDILDMLITLAKVPIRVKIDNSLLRPEDVLERVCDNRKFKELTNWSPSISIHQTLKDTLDYWRNIV